MVAWPRVLDAPSLSCLIHLNFCSKHRMAPDADPACASMVNEWVKSTGLTMRVSKIALANNLWLKQAGLASHMMQNKLMVHKTTPSTMKLAMAFRSDISLSYHPDIHLGSALVQPMCTELLRQVPYPMFSQTTAWVGGLFHQ